MLADAAAPSRWAQQPCKAWCKACRHMRHVATHPREVSPLKGLPDAQRLQRPAERGRILDLKPAGVTAENAVRNRACRHRGLSGAQARNGV